jgi:Phospholipase_D-nuclease N-terminal
MELPAGPVGSHPDQLPPAPPPGQPTYGWGAMVVPAPARQRRPSSSIALVLGVIAVVSFVVGFVVYVSDPSSLDARSTTLIWLLFAMWTLSTIFWLWMLIDAISSSRVGWALAIFFLGVFGALGYALLGRTPRTARY